MCAAPRSSLPPQAGLPPPRDWPLLLRLAVRTAIALGHGRIALARLTMAELERRNRAASSGALPDAQARRTIAWIAFIVPRVARRLPWRSDCLVQALGVQQWLARDGLASEIVIGIERPQDGGFGSHAWLRCGGTVVTGGDVGKYTIILGE